MAGPGRRAGFLSWTPPRGGLLALIKYDLPMDSLPLADTLATDYSVMLAPGSAFGYERHLRLGIGQDPAIFAEGLARAGQCFEQLTTDNEQRTASACTQFSWPLFVASCELRVASCEL